MSIPNTVKNYDAYRTIVGIFTGQANAIAAAAIDAHTALWDAPSAQEVVDYHGAGAAKLFMSHALSVQLIMLIDPSLLPENRRTVPEGCRVKILVSSGAPFYTDETPTGTPTGFVEITDNR